MCSSLSRTQSIAAAYLQSCAHIDRTPQLLPVKAFTVFSTPAISRSIKPIMYSSEQFFKDWRFRIEQDFVKLSGSPFEYVPHFGKKEWGQELVHFPFSNEIGAITAALSHDGTFLAVASKFDIIVFDTVNFKHSYTLSGHVSEVDYIAFRPGHSTQLVSSAQNNFVNTTPADPEIIFWDITNHTPDKIPSSAEIERVARNTANTVIADLKNDLNAIDWKAGDQKAFAKILEKPIGEFVRCKAVADNVKLFGRLAGNFASQIFSPSGNLMCYMPGKSPSTNGDDDWELRLYSPNEEKDSLILPGNRDAIMWTGFNQDETLVASACWDQTFRIWDTKTGTLKHIWLTDGQNWTGGFSADGKYFAGLCGDSNLFIYNLSDGTRHLKFNTGGDWSRTLSWHPSQPLIAVGNMGAGRLSLINIEGDGEMLQHRALSTRATKYPDDVKDFDPGRSMLELKDVQFVDGGRKLAFFTSGDGSAEVYDLEDGVKWRFARAGTMNPPDDHRPVTSRGGYGLLVHENKGKKQIMLGSIDGDGVRLWTVPMSS